MTDRPAAAAAAAGAGRSFVEALAAKRWDDLVAVVDPYVAFKGITLGRFWELGDANGAVRLMHEALAAVEEVDDPVLHGVAGQVLHAANHGRPGRGLLGEPRRVGALSAQSARTSWPGWP